MIASIERGGQFLRPILCVGKVRANDVFLLPGMAGKARYSAFVDCRENAHTALLERVFFHQVDNVFTSPPTPDWAVVESTLEPFLRALKRSVVPLTPVPLLDYASGAYRGRRLRVYLAATRKILMRGVRHSDSFLGTFLKYEKLLDGIKRMVPRVISPRSPQYNVAVGRYLRQLEHVIYRAIERLFGAPTVMKGYNASQLGEMMHEAWVQFTDPCAIGLDASRWDQHCSVNILKWEHGVYDLYYRSPELRLLLSWQLRNFGFMRCGDGGYSYCVNGGRCSGDMNTACGNCLVMCAAIYSLCHRLGLVKGGRCRVRLFNNGDDCVLIGERADIMLIQANVVQHFTTLGYVMKVEEIVNELEQVSFCQTQPVYDGARWRACRHPDASLTKDATILSEVYASVPRLPSQLHAIGTCGLALTAGLPVLQDYYLALTRCGSAEGTVDERFYGSGFYQLSRGMRADIRPPSMEARVSFAKAFGIPPTVQIGLESHYRSVSQLVGPIHSREVSRVPIPILGPWI